jgi:hypothetical protein
VHREVPAPFVEHVEQHVTEHITQPTMTTKEVISDPVVHVAGVQAGAPLPPQAGAPVQQQRQTGVQQQQQRQTGAQSGSRRH